MIEQETVVAVSEQKEEHVEQKYKGMNYRDPSLCENYFQTTEQSDL